MDEEAQPYVVSPDDQLTAELVWNIIRQTVMFSEYTGVRHKIFIGEYEILKNQDRIQYIQNYINNKYMVNTSRFLYSLKVEMYNTRPYLGTEIIARDPAKSEISPIDPVNSKSSSATNWWKFWSQA